MPHFEKFRHLVRSKIGIELPDQSLQSIENFLASRPAERGYQSVENYLTALTTMDLSHSEFQELVDTVTNGKTSFFRHREQLHALRDLVASLTRREARPLRLWCAGCSTGEEAYSIAIIVDQEELEAEILGTDVNQAAIEAAREGQYGTWSLREVSREVRERYFTEVDGRITIVPKIKNLVTFERHNLIDKDYPRPGLGSWDIVMCRNVFIYFRQETVASVLERIAAVLSPDGHLFVGATESLHGFLHQFSLVKMGGCFTYRLAGEGAIVAQPVLSPFLSSPLPPPICLAAAKTRQPRASTPVRQATLEAPDSPGQAPMLNQEFKAAIETHERGEGPRAIELLNAYLDRAPSDLPARVTLGNALLRRRDFAGAAEQYATALDIDPLSAEAHFFMGILYRKSGEHQRAMQAFKHTLFLNGSFWPASFYLASLYAESGQKQKARREYENTLGEISGSFQPTSMSSQLHGMEDMVRFRHDISAVCRAKLVEFKRSR